MNFWTFFAIWAVIGTISLVAGTKIIDKKFVTVGSLFWSFLLGAVFGPIVTLIFFIMWGKDCDFWNKKLF